MTTPTTFELQHGRDVAPDVAVALTAGPVSALLDGADLRSVRMGDVELAQRVYVAVRDEVWNTIPATLSDVSVDAGADHFTVSFSARHRYAGIDLTWRGLITGTADGTVSYELDGVAGAGFRYAKIGFNVHHALDRSVGRPFHAHGPDGDLDGVLPALIDPQRLINGTLTGMFAPYDQLTMSPSDDVRADFEFEGDLFEMQDHRNWTDANYKSYGTPLAVPWPMDAVPGQTFHQKVTIRASGPRHEPELSAPRVQVSPSSPRPFPQLGAMLSGAELPLSERELALLRALHLDHLRVDVYLEDPDWQERLRAAADACADLDVPAELALFVVAESEPELAALADALADSGLRLARLLVYSEGRGFSIGRRTTPPELIATVREQLAGVLESVPLAGGTNQFFAELNREYPDLAAGDGVVYSINPQTHAADDRSIMENVYGQEDTVATARHFLPGRPIHVSPVTLIGRFGPYPGGPPAEGGLPGNVDTRQMSLLAAAYTAGTIARLGRAGVDSITAYELVGWRGLMERDDGPAMDTFPSSPGMVFPVYDVLAAVADRGSSRMVDALSSRPGVIEALALSSGDALTVVVANLTGSEQSVVVDGLPGPSARVTTIDADAVAASPDRPRAGEAQVDINGADGLTVRLAPYAVSVVSTAGAGR
jgi:hypothetical protein